MRVISLVPSATETLASWGVDPIACTRFCERPDLPHVGGPKNPSIEMIVSLSPDLVVMDRQENRRSDADALTAAGIRVEALDVRSVSGLHGELAPLAEAVGVDRPEPIEPGRPPTAPTPVFVPIWRRPWMSIGPDTYGSSVLAAIGVRNVFDDAATDYPAVELDEVAERQPELVLVPSEPYTFTYEHLAELAHVAPVLRIDGQDLFWWGARTAAAIVRLRAFVVGSTG